MDYIVYADVLLDVEANQNGNCAKVASGVLAHDDYHIIFFLQGEDNQRGEITKKLCDTLIDANFYSFAIGNTDTNDKSENVGDTINLTALKNE